MLDTFIKKALAQLPLNKIINAFTFHIVNDQSFSLNYSNPLKSVPRHCSLVVRANQTQQLLLAHLLPLVIRQAWLTLLTIKNTRNFDIGLVISTQTDWKFIKVAKLANNQIGQKGVMMMVGCDWRFLSELVLSNNKIGNKGAHWLAKGIWPNLKYLSLEDCNLSSSSMRYFVRGLLNTLKYLNLRENAIGLQSLTYLISNNTISLKELDLSLDISSPVLIYHFSQFAKLPNHFAQIRVAGYPCCQSHLASKLE